MAAQRSGSNRARLDYDDDIDAFAVSVVREDGTWRCAMMSAAAARNLDAAERELRELRSSGAVFGLLDVDDEFFIIVRPAPSGTRLMLSDATAAIDYDVAADVLEALNVDVPDIDPDDYDAIEPWAEGDLGLLSDLGLPESVLGVIVADGELFADEQLENIASRLGFATELSSVLDKR
jgi:putative tRNA adenosine deaminase-associated protein